MKIIKIISERIEEEIEDAEEYIKLALKHKEENPGLAKTLYDISTDELRHADLLHTEVVMLINEHKKTVGEPPAAMLAVYEYLHGKQIEAVNKVKTYQSQYRG